MKNRGVFFSRNTFTNLLLPFRFIPLISISLFYSCKTTDRKFSTKVTRIYRCTSIIVYIFVSQNNREF